MTEIPNPETEREGSSRFVPFTRPVPFGAGEEHLDPSAEDTASGITSGQPGETTQGGDTHAAEGGTQGAAGPSADPPSLPASPRFVPFSEVLAFPGRQRAAPFRARNAFLVLFVALGLLILYVTTTPLHQPEVARALGIGTLSNWVTAVAHGDPAPPGELASAPTREGSPAPLPASLDPAGSATSPPLPTLPAANLQTTTAGRRAIMSTSVPTSTLVEGPPATPALAGQHTMSPTDTPQPPPTATTLPPTPTPTPARPPAQSPPTRLVISSIGVDIPVEPVGLVDVKKKKTWMEAWDTLPDAGAFHETTALPGHPGNTVINGHRDIHGAVFWNLNKVKRGEKIIVYAGDVAYSYVVTEVHKVRYLGASLEELDEHQQYIGTFPEERLTLLTCAPIGTATHRLYVIAEPLDSAGP